MRVESTGAAAAIVPQDAAALTLRTGAATDVGLRRLVNEDSLLVGHPLYVVADGMGGHEAGDRASRAVIDQLGALVGRTGLVPEDVVRRLGEAHSAVRSIADTTSRGAGSTVTGVAVIDRGGRPHWLVFNIGDSRVYRLRGDELVQLTVDHSVAQELIDSGELARADVGSFAGRNVITRAVGSDDSDADFGLYPIAARDTLLLCSDGLTGEVAEPQIAAILGSAADAQQGADRLVGAALAGGGRDNVTVIVVQVTGGGVSPELDEQTAVIEPLEDDDTLDLTRRQADA